MAVQVIVSLSSVYLTVSDDIGVSQCCRILEVLFEEMGSAVGALERLHGMSVKPEGAQLLVTMTDPTMLP